MGSGSKRIIAFHFKQPDFFHERITGGFLSHVTCHTYFLLFILIQIYTTLKRFDLISFVICDYKYKVYGTDQGFWKLFSVNCNVFFSERLGLRRKH